MLVNYGPIRASHAKYGHRGQLGVIAISGAYIMRTWSALKQTKLVTCEVHWSRKQDRKSHFQDADAEMDEQI